MVQSSADPDLEPPPLRGIKVLEVALYAFVPAAGAVLADWGADVVKVEHPEVGDPIRGLEAYGVPAGLGGVSYLLEVMNRGKRSVGIDIAHPSGHEVLMRLVDEADVFLTNFLAPARTRLRIEPEDILGRNPRIVYGRGTGQGTAGPDADKGGFDGVSFWARSGVSVAAMAPGGSDYPVLLPGPAYGDIQSGAHLAGGIAAALLRRERTGRGAVVDTSLLGSGMWAMQASLAGAHLADREALEQRDRLRPPNPLWNVYRTADDRFVTLSMLDSSRYWPGLCEALGRPDLIDDPRFATDELRRRNSAECTAELGQLFAAHTLADMGGILGRQDGPWAAVNTPREVLADPQAAANGLVQWVHYPGGTSLPLVPAPSRHDGHDPRLVPAPGHAADTDEVLLDAGYSMDRLIELKVQGAIT